MSKKQMDVNVNQLFLIEDKKLSKERKKNNALFKENRIPTIPHVLVLPYFYLINAFDTY